MMTECDRIPWGKALLAWVALSAVVYLSLGLAPMRAAGDTPTPATLPSPRLTVTVDDRVLPAVTITARVDLQHRIEYGDAIIQEHTPGDFSVRSTNTIVWFYVLPASGDSMEHKRVTKTIHGITGGVDGDILGAYRDMLAQRDIWIKRETSTRPSMITVTEQLESGWRISSPSG